MSPPANDERRRDAPRRRSAEESAATKPLELFDTHSRATRPPVATQLRARRAAAVRCEPLEDGRLDPWPAKELRSRQTLHVECGRRTAWIYGRDGRDVFTLLDEVGLERRQWDWQRKAWMVPIDRADDVMAYAEWKQRRTVTCEAVER